MSNEHIFNITGGVKGELEFIRLESGGGLITKKAAKKCRYTTTFLPFALNCVLCCLQQGYQWMKDKILREEGHRQQVKLKELQAVAERLSCTLPQLAIGKS